MMGSSDSSIPVAASNKTAHLHNFQPLVQEKSNNSYKKSQKPKIINIANFPDLFGLREFFGDIIFETFQTLETIKIRNFPSKLCNAMEILKGKI